VVPLDVQDGAAPDLHPTIGSRPRHDPGAAVLPAEHAQEVEMGHARTVRCHPLVDQMMLRNRLVLATSMWREATVDPLPRMPPGDPEAQLRAFELTLVDLLCARATAQSARDVADKTWDLVHDRPDDDPVKRRVVECHEALARLSARSGDPPG